MKRSFFYGLIVAGGVSVLCSLPASAGLNMKEGLWRVEVNNDFGVHQGSQDRKGDYSVNAVVEYEIPATPRATLGLRIMPLFFYDQNGGDDYRYFRRIFDKDGEGGKDVAGAGFGVDARYYQVKDEYRGWFGEGTLSALVNDGKFNGNSSNFNFVTGFGVGYQFKSDWHVQLHYQHISNGSLGDDNSGSNALGFGVGYRF